MEEKEDSTKTILEKINLPIAIIISVALILLIIMWSGHKENRLRAECSDVAIQATKDGSSIKDEEYEFVYDACIKSGGKDNFYDSFRE